MEPTNTEEEHINRAYSIRNNKFSLEIQRIDYLLKDTINKLQFAMTIPHIVENDFESIRNSLSHTELFLVQKALSKYMGVNERKWKLKSAQNRKEFLTIKTLPGLEKFFNEYQAEGETIPHKDMRDISKALHILYEQSAIRVSSTKYNTDLPEGAFNFIQEIKYLFYSTSEKIKLSPEEAILKEEHLRKMYVHHDELLDFATVMQLQTTQQLEKDTAYLLSKENEMKDWETKIDKLKEDCQEYIEKLGKEADETMIFDWKCSEEKQESLLAQIETDVGNMEMLRKKYLEEEKELRVKRYKAEQHLLAVIQQYDKDMAERQEHYEYQKNMFEQEREQLKQLQVSYDEQTIEYNQLMAEKKEYEARMIEGRMFELRCKMAARKIQRFFRKFKNLLHIHGRREGQKNQAAKAKKKKSKP